MIKKPADLTSCSQTDPPLLCSCRVLQWNLGCQDVLQNLAGRRHLGPQRQPGKTAGRRVEPY